MRREERQRGERAAEDRQRRHDDATGPVAIEQQAEWRRAHSDGHRRDAERGGDGFARPRELLGQRLQKRAEGVDEQRRKADEDADARRAGHPPALVRQVVFVAATDH